MGNTLKLTRSPAADRVATCWATSLRRHPPKIAGAQRALPKDAAVKQRRTFNKDGAH